MNSIECILFDLDGTLLDTSYDFAYALNKTCQHFKQPPLPYQEIRKTVSQGGLAMTQLAFPTANAEELEARKAFFLDVYFKNISRHTQIFPGLETGLTSLANHKISWGIVTNKPAWLTDALLENIKFPSQPKSVISGDTLPVRKPNPAPMYLAAEQCDTKPENCLYLGDHPRDIEAGINAKMLTGAAMYGYLPESAISSQNNQWPADYFFQTPVEISEFFAELTAH